MRWTFRLRRASEPRGPSFRSLVRLAVACSTAEELGQRLKRRYVRQAQRRGAAGPGRGRDVGEVAERLDGLLAQDSRGDRRRHNCIDKLQY
jgi:hypothetical protein